MTSESPCGNVVNVPDSSFEVSEFELQSCDYVHFWMNSLGNDLHPLNHPH